MLVSPENRRCLRGSGVSKRQESWEQFLILWQLRWWTPTERTRLWQQSLIHGSAEANSWACGSVWRCHREQISLGCEIFFLCSVGSKGACWLQKAWKVELQGGTVHTLTHTAEILTIQRIHVHWVMKRQDIPIIPKQAGTRIYVLHEQCVERTRIWVSADRSNSKCCLGCVRIRFSTLLPPAFTTFSRKRTITGVEATITMLHILGYNSVRSW